MAKTSIKEAMDAANAALQPPSSPAQGRSPRAGADPPAENIAVRERPQQAWRQKPLAEGYIAEADRNVGADYMAGVNPRHPDPLRRRHQARIVRPDGRIIAMSPKACALTVLRFTNAQPHPEDEAYIRECMQVVVKETGPAFHPTQMGCETTARISAPVVHTLEEYVDQAIRGNA